MEYFRATIKFIRNPILLAILMKFGQRPCTIVQGLWPDFGATLKIRKKSNFDWNQLKLSIQHKNMYVYQKKL